MSGESILDRHRREAREKSSAGDNGIGNRDGNIAGDADQRGLAVSEAFVSMLDFVLPGGRCIALPYATLLKAECEGSSKITLAYSTDTVTITGRRLDPLYKAIVQHRAREVKVAINADRSATFESGGAGAGSGGGPGGGDEVVVAAVTITPQE